MTTSPLRVLFVNENIGGHATVHLNLRIALAGRRDVAARFIDVPRGGLVRRIVAAQIPGLAEHDLDLQPLRNQLAQSVIGRRLLSPIAADEIDVLHIYTHNIALLSSDLLRRHPTVVTLDSTNALNAYRLVYREPTKWTPRMLPPTLWFERRVYAATTLVVAKSEWVAQSLRETYGVPDDKIRVLPLGVRLPPPPSGNAVRPDPPEITFVGRQMDRKGGWRLLDLHQRHLAGRCVLNLVTTDPVPPAPGVHVHRDIEPGDPRLVEILRRSSAFVFPSEVDQAPNAVIEALAAGVPVVTLQQGALAEMVEDGVSGFVVPVADDQALVRAVERLLDDADLREAMGRAASIRARERYDAERSTDALVTILHEAVERFVPKR